MHFDKDIHVSMYRLLFMINISKWKKCFKVNLGIKEIFVIKDRRYKYVL